MSQVVYDSGLLDFSGSEETPVEVSHNLGHCPQVIQFMGDLNGELGFPTLTGVGGDEIAGPYLQDVTDPNTLKVFKPDVYTFSGKFRIKIFE